MNTNRILYFASISVVVGYLLYLLILSLSNIGFYVRVLGWKALRCSACFTLLRV